MKPFVGKLTQIPGVGKSIAKDLHILGIRMMSDLKDKDPDVLYETLNKKLGYQDRCVLYVFRCAVYFATSTKHDPRSLKWWNWKD